MEVPPKLYKYQPFNTLTITNLKNNKIFFSRPPDFNDPFDSMVRFVKGTPTKQEYLKFYKIYCDKISQEEKLHPKYLTDGKLNEKFPKLFDKIQKDIIAKRNHNFRFEKGVACFSAKNDDILMWAHYADGHRGFCLEFDTTYAPFNKARKVNYIPDIPQVNILNAMLNKTSPKKNSADDYFQIQLLGI